MHGAGPQGGVVGPGPLPSLPTLFPLFPGKKGQGLRFLWSEALVPGSFVALRCQIHPLQFHKPIQVPDVTVSGPPD